MYSTELQLIDQFGEAELSQILDEGTDLTAAGLRTKVAGGDMSGFPAAEQTAATLALKKIVTAQEMAAGTIDGYISTRYTLPLATVPTTLTAYSLDIVRYRLWDNKAPEEVRQRYEDALAWLRDVAKGLAGLGIDESADTDTGPVERTHDYEDRIFTIDTLSDF